MSKSFINSALLTAGRIRTTEKDTNPFNAVGKYHRCGWTPEENNKFIIRGKPKTNVFHDDFAFFAPNPIQLNRFLTIKKTTAVGISFLEILDSFKNMGKTDKNGNLSHDQILGRCYTIGMLQRGAASR